MHNSNMASGDLVVMPTPVCVYDTHPHLQVFAQATGIPLKKSKRWFSELGREINAYFCCPKPACGVAVYKHCDTQGLVQDGCRARGLGEKN